jgi:hypothetical protein
MFEIEKRNNELGDTERLNRPHNAALIRGLNSILLPFLLYLLELYYLLD